jgi:hypothetical protein
LSSSNDQVVRQPVNRKTENNIRARLRRSRTPLQELSKLPKPAFLKEKMPIAANVTNSQKAVGANLLCRKIFTNLSCYKRIPMKVCTLSSFVVAFFAMDVGIREKMSRSSHVIILVYTSEEKPTLQQMVFTISIFSKADRCENW